MKWSCLLLNGEKPCDIEDADDGDDEEEEEVGVIDEGKKGRANWKCASACEKPGRKETLRKVEEVNDSNMVRTCVASQCPLVVSIGPDDWNFLMQRLICRTQALQRGPQRVSACGPKQAEKWRENLSLWVKREEEDLVPQMQQPSGARNRLRTTITKSLEDKNEGELTGRSHLAPNCLPVMERSPLEGREITDITAATIRLAAIGRARPHSNTRSVSLLDFRCHPFPLPLALNIVNQSPPDTRGNSAGW
ncbi:unnamed protein product [Schistocephalus solidus]|uniref:Uncharacterized protein n=1 Tax=Schistocephalus solidus TaxID=70667 RepID=A0A183SV58_SCHSO|nr:unnamed protein product [Schistocephalus solidus]